MNLIEDLENGEYEKILWLSEDTTINSYALYKLNRLNEALETSNSISNTITKNVLQAQIYYRLNDFSSALDCYKRSELSGTELETNKQLLMQQFGQNGFEEMFNSVLHLCQKQKYPEALTILNQIEISQLDNDDLMSLEMQKGCIFYHTDEYKKSIQVFANLVTQLGSPFYVSPKLMKLFGFIKSWPTIHKTSSIRNTKQMQSDAALIVPLTINLLAAMADYLSHYYVKLFINNQRSTVISKCKDASHLFKKCIKSNVKWLKHLFPRYTPYDDAIKVLQNVISEDHWFYKLNNTAMTVEDVKLLRNEQGIKALSLGNASTNLESAILHKQVESGTKIEKQQGKQIKKILDPSEYIDYDFNK